MEIWKICSRDGLLFPDYEVSDQGRVRRLTSTRKTPPGFIMSPHFEADIGYYRIMLRLSGKQYRCSIHSLVAEAFLGPRPEGLVINHKDGDKRNCCVSNLEYCTPSQNAIHAIEMGLKSPLKGEDHPGVKLNDNIVRWIRLGIQEKLMTKSSIARILDVSWDLIDQIEKGKLWKHLLSEEIGHVQN